MATQCHVSPLSGVATLLIVFAMVAQNQCFTTKNLTVYRVTPRNITGDVTNKNTGDAGGDLYFSIYEMIFPLYCLEDPTDSSCTARKTLNIPNNNVFERSTIEVDTRFGVYNGCVPSATNASQFVCQPYANMSKCWWDPAFHGPGGRSYDTKAYESLCNKSVCVCDALVNQTLGAYNSPMSQWPVFWHKQSPMWLQIEAISKLLDGWWYSTKAPGQCAEGKSPGDGSCFWQFHGVNRRVNATCVNNRVKAAIMTKNKPCFNRLPNPTNASTIPWVECLMTTITGMDYGNITGLKGGMSKAELTNSFLSGFAPSADGGCDI
eukprot:m.99639 g.99639  ORF g.99639 m.99639 type:complete len:320 (-) comp27176_c0_seq3:72-1031(-)